ncbi:MAG: unsaturated chondroitin disaccharide hydrolase, partial [Thermoproteota archaeon]|nr:unsaturated chondroitin disaccharide hydrolase [Thermoproteota archaeon]
MKNKLLFSILVVSILLVSLNSGNVALTHAAVQSTWSTRSQMIAAYLDLTVKYPTLVKSEVIGQSVNGLPIYLLSVGNFSAPRNKTILITCAQHGMEYVGTEAIYSTLVWLLSGKESVSNTILSKNLIRVVYIVNMDNYKTRNQWNAHGVNLNRNYPTFWGFWNTANTFNIGEYPLSEPEALAVDNQMSLNPAWYLDVHTGGARITPPIDANGKTVDRTFYKNMVYSAYSSLCRQRHVSPLAYQEDTASGGLDYKTQGGQSYCDSYWAHESNALVVECSTNQNPSYSTLPSITAKLIPLLMTVSQLSIGTNTGPNIDWYSPANSVLTVNEGESIVFNQVSSDLNGNPLSYQWKLDSINQATTQNWTSQSLLAGTHTIRVTVSDGSLADYQEWTVNVRSSSEDYTLTVNVVGSGSVTKNPNQASYASGSEVELNANPAAGWSFSGWSGALTGSTNPIQITMTGDKTVTVTFEQTPSGQLFADSFESDNFAAWSGTTVTSGEAASVSSAFVRDGAYGAKLTSNGGGGYEKAYASKTVSASSELYARGYFYVSQSGIVDVNDRFFFLIFSSGSNNLAYAGIRQTSSGIRWCLTTRSGTGYVDIYSSSAPSINRWYCVELHWMKDSANGLVEMWVDGTRVCVSTGTNTAAYGDANQLKAGIAETYGC